MPVFVGVPVETLVAVCLSACQVGFDDRLPDSLSPCTCLCVFTRVVVVGSAL